MSEAITNGVKIQVTARFLDRCNCASIRRDSHRVSGDSESHFGNARGVKHIGRDVLKPTWSNPLWEELRARAIRAT